MVSNPIRSLLSGGDRRSIGRSNEIVRLVQKQPSKVANLMECILDYDAVVAMRAADALEKLSVAQPKLLQPSKKLFLSLAAESTQKEVRWHLALILPRLQLTASECAQTAGLLQSYLEDSSAIVQTFALQGLNDLIPQDPALKSLVTEFVRVRVRTGKPAVRARCRILLARLEAGDA